MALTVPRRLHRPPAVRREKGLARELAGLTGEIERPRVGYSLNPAALEPLRAFLASIEPRGAPRSSRRA